MTKGKGGPFGDAQVAEFYDHIGPHSTREDVEFYVDLARMSAGPVLDLGCGTGRILIPIARAGVDVTGIDLSDEMLDICRKKLAEEPLEVRARTWLSRSDIQDFAVGTSVRLIMIPFRTFQHLVTVEAQLAFLTRAYSQLEEEGVLALDVFNPDVRKLVDSVGKDVKQTDAERMPDGRTFKLRLWEPRFEIPHRRIVKSGKMRTELPIGGAITRRALEEAGVL